MRGRIGNGVPIQQRPLLIGRIILIAQNGGFLGGEPGDHCHAMAIFGDVGDTTAT